MPSPHSLLCLPALLCIHLLVRIICKAQVNNSGLRLVSEQSFYLWVLWSGMLVWLLFLGYATEEKQTLSLAFHGLTSK